MPDAGSDPTERAGPTSVAALVGVDWTLRFYYGIGNRRQWRMGRSTQPRGPAGGAAGP